MQSVKIKGMSCQHCVGSVKKSLEEIPGISKVEVDLEKGVAHFVSDGVTPETIKAAIEQIGFEAVD